MRVLSHVQIALGLLASLAYLLVFTADGAPLLWALLWAGSIALAAFAPLRPELGIAAYAAVLYGTPRYSDLFVMLARSQVLNLDVLLAVSGAGIWLTRAGWGHRPMASPVVVAIGFFCWVGASALAALAGPWDPAESIRHPPAFLVHALMLLLVASQILDRWQSWRTFVVALCVGVCVRALWQGADGLRLEGDIGPIALMMLPLCLVLAEHDPSRALRRVMLLASAGALPLVALTYNRASAVAFGVLSIVLLWRARRRPWILAGATGVLIVAGAWLAQTDYRDRFEQAWAELTDGGMGSVTERLELWRAGLAIVRDHPILGVGFGRYDEAATAYAPNVAGMVAHNSYVQVAAESGVPGLLAYLGLFVLVLARLQRLYRTASSPRVGGLATGLQSSVLVYLSAGLFISRHDMVLAYILVGGAAALTSQGAIDPARSEGPSVTTPVSTT